MKLKEIFNLMEQSYVHGRKTPCDISEFMCDTYYSVSKDVDIKYADMDITHYIRSQLKNSNETTLYNELVKAKSDILKLKRKVSKALDN